MEFEPTVKGFVFDCTKTGLIQQVRHDDLDAIEAKMSLLSIVDPKSITKVLSFLRKVNENGSCLGWEVNFKFSTGFQTFYLAGIKGENLCTIIGSSEIAETRKYFNDLMLISNTQNNQLRKVTKENIQAQQTLKQSEQAFNDLTQLNNEMANMQRELAKKNRQLQELNAELEQKNKELDQFAYIITHDLKAPLVGVTSVIGFIKDDHWEELSEDVKEMFEMVNKRTNRMKDLIESILSYSRAGKMDIEVSVFEMKEMYTEIIDALAIPAGFVFHLPEFLPKMQCSYVQLSQVLTNLMGNAVKYHDKDAGNIYLNIEKKEENLLKFSVRDDGPGIPEKYQAKLFEPFETAHGTNRKDSTGIGLAIVKKLVIQNGGKIGLDSELGKGSTFWFTWKQNAESL